MHKLTFSSKTSRNLSLFSFRLFLVSAESTAKITFLLKSSTGLRRSCLPIIKSLNYKMSNLFHQIKFLLARIHTYRCCETRLLSDLQYEVAKYTIQMDAC